MDLSKDIKTAMKMDIMTIINSNKEWLATLYFIIKVKI